jgi:hypothetical protein
MITMHCGCSLGLILNFQLTFSSNARHGSWPGSVIFASAFVLLRKQELNNACSMWPTRQTMYLQNNTDARSCNHRCMWKSNKYHLFVCVCNLSYPAWKAHALYYIVVCLMSFCILFFHIIYLTLRFSDKRSYSAIFTPTNAQFDFV